MKVIYARDFGDDNLRKIRFQTHKGSRKATRQEVRLWIDRLVTSTLETMEGPKLRRKAGALDALLEGAEFTMPRLPKYDAPPDTPCAKCGKPKLEHGGARLDCPLSRSVKPGSRFTLAVAS